MSNPTFDAAMLLRGLRAMDAALGESYNVTLHTCIPSPVVYSSDFPEAGIDFSKYQGIEGLKGTWRGWMYEDGGKGKLKDAVHPDVEETVVEAFGILDKCDKSKDGHITKSEWQTCQRGRSGDDQLWDIEFLTALFNVTGKLLIVEKNQPLNPADPETYPELVNARADAKKKISEKDGQIGILKIDLDKSREETALYEKISYGLGSSLGLVALVLGVRALWRKRTPERPNHPEANRAIARDQTPEDPGIPRPAAGRENRARVAAVAEEDRPTAAPTGEGSVTAAVFDELARIANADAVPGGVAADGAPMSITADNVIISGEHAAPVAALDVEVLRAQIGLTYRQFLTRTARAAIEAGRSLPAGTDPFDSPFRGAVDAILTRAIARVEELRTAGDLRDAMSPEYDRHFFIRGGAPQLVILQVGSAYIASEAARAGSPFEGGDGDRIRAEAERRAGEIDFMERGLREFMRRLGR